VVWCGQAVGASMNVADYRTIVGADSDTPELTKVSK